MDLHGRKALVIGLGLTGLSMARWLHHRGAQVRVVDTRAVPPYAAQLAQELPDVPVRTGAFQRDDFAGIDLVAVSPGVSITDPIIADAQQRGIPVVGDVELFAQALAALPNCKVLAITGSNGKSTVTEMTGALCKAAGANTVVAGNIGLPVLDTVLTIERASEIPPDVFVLELSSFQLETTQTLSADAAACLNVTEDHLDRYADMRAYAQAKARIFRGHGTQILNRQDTWCLGMAAPGRTVQTFGLDAPDGANEWGVVEQKNDLWLTRDDTNILPLSELQVTGMHNAANALAALALADAVGLNDQKALDGLRSFKGLPHRVQKVAFVNGVTFYDDSKGTNVGATVAALKGLREKVVLIAGGDGKGQDFTPLRAAVAAHARAVVLIGRDRERIAEAISQTGVPQLRAADMQEAVRLGLSAAQPGDAVLLSPACASFDMFRNYGHRAEVFVAAVQELARG